MNKKIQGTFISILMLAGFLSSTNAFSEELVVQSEKICRSCHDNHRNDPLLKRSNPDAHHRLHGTEILTLNAPNAANDSDGIYDCLTCHPISKFEGGPVDISTERDCIQCHYDNENTSLSGRHHKHSGKMGINGAIIQCASCHNRRNGIFTYTLMSTSSK